MGARLGTIDPSNYGAIDQARNRSIPQAGFAFFIDDIPGAGSSTGTIKKVYRDRAMILCKEVETLKSRPDISRNKSASPGIVRPA